ncbi:unnamed protein product [marine sediment metagenome]|uniref:Uncharacterized protein n=1 Tax=marine sediment metagenome TaxID=412755 RepID=X1P3E3_9ZZZZ
MVKGVKDNMVVPNGHVVIRVSIPKSTYRALKVKCALMEITVRKGMTDLVEQWVKDVKKDIGGIGKIKPKA